MSSSFVELQLQNRCVGLHMLNHNNRQVKMISVMEERKKIYKKHV